MCIDFHIPCRSRLYEYVVLQRKLPSAKTKFKMSECIICLDSGSPLFQSGCACRGDSGLAHVGCLVENATAQRPHRGDDVWRVCQTCKQEFTGAMRTGLAEAWWARVRHQAEENQEWLLATSNLANCRRWDGRYADSEHLQRQVLRVRRKALGEEHANTLTTKANLALSLKLLGKYAEAERIEREVLGVERRVLGEEHPSTLITKNNLAVTITSLGKHAEAEQISREALEVLRRLHGEEHPSTMVTAANLAGSLFSQRKYFAAERINREVFEVQKRVLGAEHPDTLMTAHNLGDSLLGQGKFAEAIDRIFRQVVPVMRRVFGEAHPQTLMSSASLATALTCQGKASMNRGASTADAGLPRLPGGTRMLVQELVSKPEHNGKLARVLSFDELSGRYLVGLDDGKRLLLKPECVARAGCAAAGCTSEEASSVCARCQAVRYCSRECQRADWKAHKPACTSHAP